ncbi:MAG TPA: hypothetical protein VHF47_08975 [Acidimicrobiales bacterium]|nr:hypothetical protein [Acidimicrobiales bacterium]
MIGDLDRFEAAYADRLWSLMPAVYRADDGDGTDAPGPLQELVTRVARQAAVVRRSTERLWQDQSIETCDDWVVPYLADLLATNLVAGLDARGHRLDVAKTISYRRRKGTLGVLEELARDVTAWEARVVEMFRRLGRTRHLLDPPIGRPADTDDPPGHRALQLAQGLVGPRTGTPLGGLADLRHVYGASRTGTAFDEFAHRLDVRGGLGALGWYNIPRLGVFLWRLRSFPVGVGMPVPVAGCPGHFVFDPTGREVPLFARPARTPDMLARRWAPAEEWQVPTPIGRALLDEAEDRLCPRSIDVLRFQGGFLDSLDLSARTVYPERGRFKVDPALAPGARVTYCYGFAAAIGAGPYDRRVLGSPAAAVPTPVLADVTGGGGALAARLATLGASGTVTLADSLTYDAVADVGAPTGLTAVRVAAANRIRPVLRPAAVQPWAFTGAAGSSLVLEGLLLSGRDVVLRGRFDRVVVDCCTLDPGASGADETPPAVFATASDGRALRPSRVWVEATVRRMEVRRSIVGAVRTRGDGSIAHLSVSDSILQSVRTSGYGAVSAEELKDPGRLAARIRDGHDPLSAWLHGQLAAAETAEVDGYGGGPVPASLGDALATGLTSVIAGPSVYDATRFALVAVPPPLLALVAATPTGAAPQRLNRLLLEAAYPLELADVALGTSDGEVELDRCTVLGQAYVHRLEASECILDDVTVVEDVQRGCVRFSAWATGSRLPRPYRSVEIDAGAALFTSTSYGNPGYAQLRSDVDAFVRFGGPDATIAEGGPRGSEMGAFAREAGAVRRRGLGIKYGEYMPLGLAPVPIDVT